MFGPASSSLTCSRGALHVPADRKQYKAAGRGQHCGTSWKEQQAEEALSGLGRQWPLVQMSSQRRQTVSKEEQRKAFHMSRIHPIKSNFFREHAPYHVLKPSQNGSSDDPQKQAHYVEDSSRPQKVVEMHHILAALHLCVLMIASHQFATTDGGTEEETAHS